jgi:TnpA family transposase
MARAPVLCAATLLVHPGPALDSVAHVVETHGVSDGVEGLRKTVGSELHNALKNNYLELA